MWYLFWMFIFHFFLFRTDEEQILWQSAAAAFRRLYRNREVGRCTSILCPDVNRRNEFFFVKRKKKKKINKNSSMSSVKPSQCRGDESLCGRPSALPRHSETSLTEGKTTTKPSKNTTRHPHYKLRVNPSIFHQTYQTTGEP
ncbi:hypothetical protein F4823DRAFT_619552 [Ustulina deusta]|nr:hypothetical protein F4823DRAFT_619552 [Ustulina deusta]